MTDKPLQSCPKCASAIRKTFSVPQIGYSKSSFDAKAKNAGFHKLKKLGKGEYEKQY
jgi:predicted nucleic acid-binding Zn ribbon protein